MFNLEDSTVSHSFSHAPSEEGQALKRYAAENVFEIASCPHDWLFPHFWGTETGWLCLLVFKQSNAAVVVQRS